ncbi:hypothetical protein [Elizabethkingia ursingii]|uniref:hypothetical protein n=1 Tax=Elizabethkingia ursingii TaxID=1756150 RepID=UPI0020110F38|nr:hypothetical protein [Elizabethkingia ursingii]MCL1671738.1 hypothetical protein [Elizabethkingia ursingii]
MNYIISLTHTRRHEEYITLWRSNNAGYCYSKENAGVYESPEKGYHDSDDNMPISVEDADKLFQKLPYDGIEKDMIPNNKETWGLLGVKMTKNGLIKVKDNG